MKPVRIAPPASEEFTEAIRWYEGKRIGLGGEFYDAVLHTVSLSQLEAAPGFGRSVCSESGATPLT